MYSMTLEDYLHEMNIPYKNIKNHEEFSDYIAEQTHGELWAYPMEEEEYCRQENIIVVIIKLEDELCLAQWR